MPRPSRVSLPVIFRIMKPKVDKSWTLWFETRELNGVDIQTLSEMMGSEGWIVISPNDDISEGDIPVGEADSGLEGKSPSERLRNVLYVLWEQSGKPTGSFEIYRAAQMEKLIEVIKEKLE